VPSHEQRGERLGGVAAVIQPKEMRFGDYTATRFNDTEAEREDLKSQMREQGCKSIRFETTPWKVLIAHGYLQMLGGAEEL
jgi:hypothetical protein